MKSLMAMLVVTAVACGQDCVQPQASKVAAFQTIQFAPKAPAKQFSQEEIVAETEFLKSGPRLYSMAKAQQLHKDNGLPVLCWMGKDIFKDPKARAESLARANDTIQAAMDEEPDAKDRYFDQFNPRVKFSSGNYGKKDKVYFIQVKNFGPDTGSKILEAAGGAPVK